MVSAPCRQKVSQESAAQSRRKRPSLLTDLTKRLTEARREYEIRTRQVRAFMTMDVSCERHARAYRKLCGARRHVAHWEGRLNERLQALGNFCVGDAADIQECDP